MQKITIRKAGFDDLDAIMRIYDIARGYMRSNGNVTQWTGGYPSRELITDDIREGVCHVGVDCYGEVVMVFALIIGEDPTYAVIENGSWLNDRPYGTIHRLGSSRKYRGMLRLCVEYCFTKIDNLRLDTHADNSTMLNAVEKLGFERCGIIYCDDGTPRTAFQKSIMPPELPSAVQVIVPFNRSG